jgi:hypothetical protein
MDDVEITSAEIFLQFSVAPCYKVPLRNGTMTQTLQIGFYGILTNPVVGYEKLTEIMVEKGIRII